jgi:dolichyl-phosphate-mannose--protein O-mannosyl transferase
LTKHKLVIDIDLTAAWQRTWDIIGQIRVEHFLLFLFAAHMLQIAFPSDGSMVFDEAHYVPASLKTLAGEATNLEHPPLAKIIGAIGIAVLGNNWFGWRFPQVLMQIAGLYLFYLVAKRVLGGDPWALGATMLLGLDTLFFIHGGILLLDTTAFLLGFLTIELYFRKRYWWSAVSMGLAFFAREFALFIFITLVVYHLAANRGALKKALKFATQYTLIALLVMGILLTIYDIGYQPALSTSITNIVKANVVMQNGTAITTIYTTSQSISKEIMWNPVQNILFMMTYHGAGGITINETYRSYQYAWNWILPVHISPTGMVTWDTFDAATYYSVAVTVTTDGQVRHYTPIWYRAMGNPVVWYGIWPALVALALALKRRQEVLPSVFILTGILVNYLPNLVLSIVTRRLGFNYYMFYVLPFAALGIAFAWKYLLPKEDGRQVLAFNVVLALVFFLWFFPVRPMP